MMIAGGAALAGAGGLLGEAETVATPSSSAAKPAGVGAKAVLHSTVLDWNKTVAKPTAVGSVRSFVDQPTPMLANLEIHVTTLNPGQSPHPPHQHAHEELMIVREGELEALVQGEWKPAGPGSILFMASNELHGVRNPGSVPAVYHVIAIRTLSTQS